MERHRIYYDSHMHTPLCNHAIGEPEEYAETALETGLRGIIFTCHCPMPNNFWPEVRMKTYQLRQYVEMIERCTKKFKGKIDVKLGLESDYFPGYEQWLEELHNRAEFHYILGSVHFFGQKYLDKFWHGSVREFQLNYFKHLADAAESKLFDCLSHPDIIKNFGGGEDWDFDELAEEIGHCLDRISATGIAMELNTSGAYKKVSEMNPSKDFLKLMQERKIPVVIGSDSHEPGRVGDLFFEALDLLEHVGYQNVSYFHARERYDLPIDYVRKTLS